MVSCQALVRPFCKVSCQASSVRHLCKASCQASVRPFGKVCCRALVRPFCNART